jgi:hypothetical protein
MAYTNMKKPTKPTIIHKKGIVYPRPGIPYPVIPIPFYPPNRDEDRKSAEMHDLKLSYFENILKKSRNFFENSGKYFFQIFCKKFAHHVPKERYSTIPLEAKTFIINFLFLFKLWSWVTSTQSFCKVGNGCTEKSVFLYF